MQQMARNNKTAIPLKHDMKKEKCKGNGKAGKITILLLTKL